MFAVSPENAACWYWTRSDATTRAYQRSPPRVQHGSGNDPWRDDIGTAAPRCWCKQTVQVRFAAMLERLDAGWRKDFHERRANAEGRPPDHLRMD